MQRKSHFIQSSLRRRCAFESLGTHAALHGDHLVRRGVVAGVGRAGAVGDEAAFEAAIIRLSHGRVDAHVRCDAAEEEALASRRAEEVLEVGREEGALSRLVDDVLGWERLQIVDQLPARLAAHEDAAARTGLANLGADGGRTKPLVLGEIGEARAVAFARMDNAHAAARAAASTFCSGLIGLRVAVMSYPMRST